MPISRLSTSPLGRFVLPQGALAPPPHFHPAQVEEYEVIEGSFDVVVDGAGRRSADYPETIHLGGRRERIPMRAMAGLGRLLRLPTAAVTSGRT